MAACNAKHCVCALLRTMMFAAIEPHFGPVDIRLRVHVPILIPSTVPEECGIRVGDTIRAWDVNQPLVFDDAYQHGTWNHTTQDRVVLLFDMWHPDLTHAEREALKDMFSEARQKGWLS
ncbi:aspartyl/asparaginyl beta-hydroxylase domain-containing protein [archaeon]|nr:MAG: aspartyl/asparaginyl beta-hydroxylase domain-containing protein [archaeon]